MKKQVLYDKVAEAKMETKNALQTIYDALNPGQQKQIVKDEKVKTLFDRYSIKYDNNI